MPWARGPGGPGLLSLWHLPAQVSTAMGGKQVTARSSHILLILQAPALSQKPSHNTPGDLSLSPSLSFFNQLYFK